MKNMLLGFFPKILALGSHVTQILKNLAMDAIKFCTGSVVQSGVCYGAIMTLCSYVNQYDVKTLDYKTYFMISSLQAICSRIPQPSKANSQLGVRVLTDSNFNDSISSGYWFIEFYAPWCDACISFAPRWDELAKLYDNVNGLVIAKVDCTENGKKKLCRGILSYPTLKLFKNGVEVEKYSRSRSIEEMSAFLKEKTGL
jgi:protein disulfide-isomerase-like protein